MEYKHIVNPVSGRKVNLFGNQGKKIINNYLKIIQHGGNGCNGLRKDPCIEHKGCEWGPPTGKKPNRCFIPKLHEPTSTKKHPEKPSKNTVAVKALKKPIATKSSKKPVTNRAIVKPRVYKPESSDCIEATSENGFTPSQVKKYQGRPSPPYPAANCANEEMYGQGKGANTLYRSVPRGKSYVWAKV